MIYGRYELSAFSDRGQLREDNEDNFYLNNHVMKEQHGSMKSAFTTNLSSSDERICCFGLFDGMGGEAYGEKASLIAARTCGFYDKKASHVYFSDPESFTQDEIINFLKKLAVDMNREVVNAAERLKCSSMGSTAAILLLYRDRIFSCTLGDSRIYFIRNGRFRQVSEDQTNAAMLQELGIQNRRPSLTQYLGIPEEQGSIDPDIRIFDLNSVEGFLLASDGLTDMLSEEEIGYHMRNQDTAAAAETLVRSAVAAGGRDNITVIVGRML